MIDTLVEALTDAATDDGLRAIHIRGAGDDFCSGADWVASNGRSEYRRRASTHRSPGAPHPADRSPRDRTGAGRRAARGVHGARAGRSGLGCNLALAADFTVAADDAVFWEPFLARGFSPDSGATWLLPRLVGVARARRMLLLGEKVSGAEPPTGA